MSLMRFNSVTSSSYGGPHSADASGGVSRWSGAEKKLPTLPKGASVSGNAEQYL